MKQGFVYVLHFSEPLSHAKHYIGSTTRPIQRFKAHAAGAGSNLCRVLIERGITFKVGLLATCTFAQQRRLERRMKDQKNSSRYCQLCHEVAAKFPGTIPYPFEFDSKSVMAMKPNIEIITEVHEDDWKSSMNDVKRLMSFDKDALGFIPAGEDATSGLLELFKSQKIAIARFGREVIGYAAYTTRENCEYHGKEFSPFVGKRAKIHQCVVKDEYRLLGIARQLVKAVAEKSHADFLACTVREDLVATEFWKSCEFIQVDFREHKTSGSTLIDFECFLDWSNGSIINTFNTHTGV